MTTRKITYYTLDEFRQMIQDMLNGSFDYQEMVLKPAENRFMAQKALAIRNEQKQLKKLETDRRTRLKLLTNYPIPDCVYPLEVQESIIKELEHYLKKRKYIMLFSTIRDVVFEEYDATSDFDSDSPVEELCESMYWQKFAEDNLRDMIIAQMPHGTAITGTGLSELTQRDYDKITLDAVHIARVPSCNPYHPVANLHDRVPEIVNCVHSDIAKRLIAGTGDYSLPDEQFVFISLELGKANQFLQEAGCQCFADVTVDMLYILERYIRDERLPSLIRELRAIDFTPVEIFKTVELILSKQLSCGT